VVELSHWQDIVVPQRNDTGCIPTGYEWIIRYLNIEDVELTTFQEDFDLDLGRKHPPYQNNFESVGNSITLRYPQINIEREVFQQGLEKIRATRSLLERDIPCLLSFALHGLRTLDNRIIERAWHIMPVVFMDDHRIKMIHHANERANYVMELPTSVIIWRHNNLEGGKEVSWVLNPNASI
jgi:hypothetical protein